MPPLLNAWYETAEQFLEAAPADIGEKFLILWPALTLQRQGRLNRFWLPADVADWPPLDVPLGGRIMQTPGEMERVAQHLQEAFNKLLLDEIMVPAPGTNGLNGWLNLTPKGREAMEALQPPEPEIPTAVVPAEATASAVHPDPHLPAREGAPSTESSHEPARRGAASREESRETPPAQAKK